jgi:hypothetical protein
MSNEDFPTLHLAEWRSTRDAIHDYARLAGAIRAALSPPQRHWWHLTLHCAALGLSTTLVPADGFGFEIQLDLVHHRWVLSTSTGERWSKRIHGQSVSDLCDETLTFLADLDIRPEIDTDRFDSGRPHEYDPAAAERYWAAMVQIQTVLNRFRAGLGRQSGPVHLFPHHFDLALQWFSGRHLPGEAAGQGDEADEQMGFGFATGDDAFADPYFYATAHPSPPALLEAPLPTGARWTTHGYTGALMPYAELTDADGPRDRLYDFFTTAWRAGAALMGT